MKKFGSENTSLADIRTLAICLISFAVFSCYDEIANLRESDVLFIEDHIQLYIESISNIEMGHGY